MSKKRIELSPQKLDKYYAQFPAWYWKYGLHDAIILSVSKLELEPNYKENQPKWNCLEILLNSKNALYESDIKKISLYNYKIESPDIDVNNIDKTWWMSDTIKQLPNGHYFLEIEIESAQKRREQFSVRFETAEIERK